jgi:hypothetical protein
MPVTEFTTCPSTVCAAKATDASIDPMRNHTQDTVIVEPRGAPLMHAAC